MTTELVTLVEFKTALAGMSTPGARTAANLPDDRLQAALDDAHAEVLGKVATRYTIPATAAEAPDMLLSIVTAVAAYAATLEWMQGKDLSDRDAVVLRYQRALGMLKAITDGILILEGLEAPAGGATSDAEVFNTVPAVGLTQDVNAPTYDGMVSGGWQGGGRVWSAGW